VHPFGGIDDQFAVNLAECTIMAKIRDVLSPADYQNYRNIRAVSLLFMVVGGILALSGVLMISTNPLPGQERPPMLVSVLLAAVGLCGAIGGFATFRGLRNWAKLAYIMSALYLLGFPAGTILGYVMLKGLSRYLDSVDSFREQQRARVGAAQ
jgi:hypothetical protein